MTSFAAVRPPVRAAGNPTAAEYAAIAIQTMTRGHPTCQLFKEAQRLHTAARLIQAWARRRGARQRSRDLQALHHRLESIDKSVRELQEGLAAESKRRTAQEEALRIVWAQLRYMVHHRPDADPVTAAAAVE